MIMPGVVYMQRHENAEWLMVVADCMLNKLQYQ